jgi:hypothetical protein
MKKDGRKVIYARPFSACEPDLRQFAPGWDITEWVKQRRKCTRVGMRSANENGPRRRERYTSGGRRFTICARVFAMHDARLLCVYYRRSLVGSRETAPLVARHDHKKTDLVCPSRHVHAHSQRRQERCMRPRSRTPNQSACSLAD